MARPWWQPRGRRAWLGVGAAAVLLVGLVAAVVVLLVRPAPASTPASPPVAQQPSPHPTPSAGPSPPTSKQTEQKQFRAYVVMTVTRGTALAGAMASFKDCGDRSACEQRLAAAEAQVNSFQQALDANPPPACLSTTDQHLRNGLTFQEQGFQLAQQAITVRDRVKLAQSAALVGAGTWQERLAVKTARESDC